MHLYRLTIINFKSVKCLTLDFERDHPNIFIGINDCGKSTILGALRLLLDTKGQFNFQSESKAKSDISNSPLDSLALETCFISNGLPTPDYTEKQTFIVGQFKIEDEEIGDEFQEEASAHLKWTLEKSGTIKIMKSMDTEKSTSSYYLASFDNLEKKSFWSMPKSILNSEVKAIGISDDEMNNDNNKGPYSNLEKIRALYNRYTLEESWHPYEEKDLKNDLKFYPKFRLLDWNFSLKDLEEIAQEAMDEAIGKYETQLRSQARILQEQARVEVNKSFGALTETLFRELPSIRSIKSNVIFNVESKLTDIMLSKETSDGDIHLESQGDGIKRQIWFALLKFKSLTAGPSSKKYKSHLWCFDEPETHLYPAAQRDFYEVIKSISASDCQTIVSTHSTIFIDRTHINQISRVNLTNGYSEVKRCSSVDDVYESLEIKNSDFLFFNKFLAVEGPTDVEVIPHLYKTYFGRSLLSDGIQLVSLGGESQSGNNRVILENLLRDFGKVEDNLVFILDNDANTDGENTFCVGTYDFEDGIADDVWIKFVHDKTEINLSKEELGEMRGRMENRKEKKFYRLLQDLVRLKKSEATGLPAPYNLLPKKGKDLGFALKPYFTSAENIPGELIKAFHSLQSNGRGVKDGGKSESEEPPIRRVKSTNAKQ